MPAALKVKPFGRLRPQDLDRCPVWQFVRNSNRKHHGPDTPVRPLPDRLRIQHSTDFATIPQRVGLIVAARLTLADGSVCPGLFKPTRVFEWSTPPTSIRNVERDGQWLFDMNPYALTRRGPLRLWRWDEEFERREMDRLYETLGRAADEVFPIRLASLVPCDARYFSRAIIPGFIARINRTRIIS